MSQLTAEHKNRCPKGLNAYSDDQLATLKDLYVGYVESRYALMDYLEANGEIWPAMLGNYRIDVARDSRTLQIIESEIGRRPNTTH